MSDGDASDGIPELTTLNQKYPENILSSFFIGFGSNKPKLKEMADLAKGQYSTTLDASQLKEKFMEISSKFGTTIGVLRSKICH